MWRWPVEQANSDVRILLRRCETEALMSLDSSRRSMAPSPRQRWL